jgi:(4S)-4-hydroxy-5-phosphonooxypentane-2,3-dione isomerase
MYVVCVTVRVVDDHVQAFVSATVENAASTRAESGCVRFDVLRAIEDPCRFLLYEAYRSEQDFLLHQQTEHYLRWKQTVGPMMATPRVGVKHVSVSPEPWT